jgi:hypothetical protein
MPIRLDDDGTRVTLDLHGASVEQGLTLVRKAVQLAAARGRVSLNVIHGSSTSDPLARNRSLKHAVHDLYEGGGLPGVTGALRHEGSTLLSLPLGGRPDPRRLTLRDVW